MNTPPLVGVQANYLTAGGGNGVYDAGGAGFPVATYGGTSYAVDVVFDTTEPHGSPGQCPCSLWSDASPVGSVDANDISEVNLGVDFTVAASGTISGVRFYKEPDNTGAHVGSLWSSTGKLLATGTFTSESTEGWEELDFSTPVAVTAGTAYVASYFTATGHYAVTQGGLNSGFMNGGLTVPANGGVYAYGSSSAFPSSSYKGSNYWVDVVYTATPSPGQCPCSIWSASAQPAVASANDGNAVNLGVQFTSSESGWITGMRFYKGPNNPGTHVGSLWSSTGQLLGSVTFTAESAGGWQQANFSSSIPVTAGAIYTASYFAPDGGYAVDSGGLSSAVTNGPLTARASGGVYAYGSSSEMPTSSYKSSNYWVDVSFTTTAP